MGLISDYNDQTIAIESLFIMYKRLFLLFKTVGFWGLNRFKLYFYGGGLT